MDHTFYKNQTHTSFYYLFSIMSRHSLLLYNNEFVFLNSLILKYIFLKLRAKSVGETAEISILAKDDNKTRVPVKVNLDKIDIHMTADHTNEVQIDEKIKLILKYPVLRDMKNLSESDDEYKKMFAVLNKCIYEVHDGDKIYNAVDLTQKDIDEFVDSMNTSQLAKVLEFFSTMPKLRHPVSFINPKTKVKNEVVLEGLQSFLD